MNVMKQVSGLVKVAQWREPHVASRQLFDKDLQRHRRVKREKRNGRKPKFPHSNTVFEQPMRIAEHNTAKNHMAT